MKNFLSKFLLPFLAFLAITSAMATQVAPTVGISPVALTIGVTTAVIGIQLLSPSYGFIQNGVETEVWVAYIKEKLFKVNMFLSHATNHDDKVLGGKVVHLPQAGGPADTVKNRSTFPATTVRRTDTDITYVLEPYTTDPTHVTLNELMEVEYDKIDSVIGQDISGLVEFVADDMIVKWLDDLPQTSIVRTTGTASGDSLLTGATGTRKALTEGDIRRAVKAIRNQNYRDKLYAQLSVNMMDELKASLSITQSRDFSAAYDFEKGIVGKLHGVTFLDERSSVATFTDSSGDQVVKPLGAAVVAADNDGGFIWGESSVARAMGDSYLFQDVGNPQYYGDVMSAFMRAGGRRTRSDDKGIVAIVQAAG